MRGPIFIVGSMRSGSTMLRLILDSHPKIAIGPETGFMGAVEAIKRIPGWRHGEQWFARIGCSEQEIDERTRVLFGELFERFARRQGKERWGEKTPFHTLHMPQMARLFPEACFVGIVRHPGGTVVSLRDSFHYPTAQGAHYWSETNAALTRHGAALGDRFAVLRYEDLVLHTEPITRQLLAWLGEEWSPQVLQHHEIHRERGTPRVTDGGTNAHQAVDPRRVERWESALDPEERRVVDQKCAELASVYGYALDDTVSSSPLGFGEGRTLALGADLSRVREHWQKAATSRGDAVLTMPDASPHELAERAARAEAALVRVRSRRAVRVSDGVKRVRHNRSWADVDDVVRALLGKRPRNVTSS